MILESPTGVVPNKIFDAYWKFAAERQKIFWRRYHRTPVSLQPVLWTDDPILQTFKFTNTYRVLDRVSQYLLKNVIYNGASHCADNMVFRIMFFKLFNRPETWELLTRELGDEPHIDTFDFDRYDKILTAAQDRGERIYSNAYMMTAAGSNGDRRHRMYLRLYQKMFHEDHLGEKIAGGTCVVTSDEKKPKSMEEVYKLIRPYRTMGPFLAMQYAIDINYSEVTNFEETDFIIAGPGARRGILKCFDSIGEYSETDIIRWVQASQDIHFAARGLEFKKIGDRPLQLIDCQSLFCETDKYARAAFPDVQVDTGSWDAQKRARIKQKFSENTKSIEYVFPPKWGIKL